MNFVLIIARQRKKHCEKAMQKNKTQERCFHISVLLPERLTVTRFAPSAPDLTGFSRMLSIYSLMARKPYFLQTSPNDNINLCSIIHGLSPFVNTNFQFYSIREFYLRICIIKMLFAEAKSYIKYLFTITYYFQVPEVLVKSEKAMRLSQKLLIKLMAQPLLCNGYKKYIRESVWGFELNVLNRSTFPNH